LRLIKEVTKEVTKKKPNPHEAHYYRLSEHGVHYIITNNINLKYDILKGLLKNYGDHPLFRYILYPCIKRDTLLKIGDSAIFDHAFSYLYDCYQRVEDTIPSIIHKGQIDNQTQNGYVTRRLFSWDLSNEDKDILRSFLKQKYKWNWVDNARVSKTRDGNRIKVSDELNSVRITLTQSKTKAILFFKKEELLEFVVQGSDVYTSQPYRSYLRTLDPSRLPPPISPEEDYMESFLYFLHIRAQQLIFSILSNYVEPGYSAAMQILRHDPKFMQVLKETKNGKEVCLFHWKAMSIVGDTDPHCCVTIKETSYLHRSEKGTLFTNLVNKWLTQCYSHLMLTQAQNHLVCYQMTFQRKFS
jgi:hypothetical protein